MNIYEQLKGETGREGMKNYVLAVQIYVQAGYDIARRILGDMDDGSKGLGAMERAIQSLKDAQGYLEEAMREIEG